MDNDDNDYQGQGLRLASEESSKISPVLRPYALPKFDFDEGHLRFDSLVENEVFLGIPSQEDNQWIEDFSRGSSGIEFSSSAADSCSIPRRNNVWSEATSSESVEMLLKSVGQEEMIPEESIMEESAAGDELPSLTKQMDSTARQNDRAEDVKDSNSEILPVQVLGGFSALNQGTKGDVQSECVSQSQDVDLAGYEYPAAIGEKTGMIVTEENLHVELKCDDRSVRDYHTSLNESLNNKMQEDISISGAETASAVAPDITAVAGKLNVQGKVSDNSCESASGLSEDIAVVGGHIAHDNNSVVDDGKFTESSGKVCISDLHSALHIASEVEVVAKCTVETAKTNIVGPPSLPPEENSDLLKEEGCNKEAGSLEPAQDQRSRLAALAEGIETALHSESENLLPEKSSVASEGGDGSGAEGHSFEVSNNNNDRISAGFKKESAVEICHGHDSCNEGKDDYQGNKCPVGKGDSVILTEEFMLSGTLVEPTEQGQHVDDQGDDHALILEKSVSVGSIRAKDGIESLKDEDDIAAIHDGDIKAADHVSPCQPVGSLEICGEVSAEQVVPTQDEREGENLTSDSNNTKCETVVPYDDGEKIGLSSLNKVTKENVGRTNGLNIDASVGNEPAFDAEVDSNKTGSCDKDDDVPELPASGAPLDEVANHNEDLKSHPSAVGTLPSDKKEEMEAADTLDAGMSLLASRDVAVEPCPDPAATKDAMSDSNVEMVTEDVNQSLNTVESSDRDIHVELAVSGANQQSPGEIGLLPVHSHSSVREPNVAGSADTVKLKEATTEKDNGISASEVTGGGSSAGVEKSNVVSTSILGAAELSQGEAVKQIGITESTGEDVPLSNGADGVVRIMSDSPKPQGGNDTNEEERSFTFDISPLAGLPEGETSKGWQSFSIIQAGQMSTLVEGSPSSSAGGHRDPKVAEEASHGNTQTHNKKVSSGGSKSATERKPRRASRSVKGSARKGNQLKEAVPERQTEVGDNLSVFLSPSGKAMQLEVGSCGTKPSGILSLPGSSVPDLNTSASTTLLFQQPFTDLQQVQLRAQIFVYGSLIQGVAPDEGCMISAFGMSDGVRSNWEPAWRSCMERLHGQKPQPSCSETPVQSRSGAKASDQANKQGLNHSKARASSKGNLSSVGNSMIPLSSPLWNIATPSSDALPTNNMARGAIIDYQTISPLHAYQTPASRNFAGHTTWLSQAPFPVPWVASPQNSPFDISGHFSALPTTETVKLTPIKESSMLNSSIKKHAAPVPVGQVGASAIVSGNSSVHDMKKATVSHPPPSADPKSRKRKKASASEDLGPIGLPVNQMEPVSAPAMNSHFANKSPAAFLLARTQPELVSASASNSQYSTTVAIPTPFNLGSKSNLDKYVTAMSPVTSNDHQKGGDRALEKRALDLEGDAKVEEAKLQAEAASGHAALAVSHCQSVWSQLDKQKNSGLMSDVEAKLASTAVTIAAAASVAKAAAAAAKIASDVAVHAKLLADEAFNSSGTLSSLQNNAISLPGFVNSMGSATPASILKVGDGNNGSSSIIFAAREAARRRVEAASAASRHAENLDAIVKAAELAAEAVSQAGKIVAIGDPMPLSKLVEAGLEGYWKSSDSPHSQVVKAKDAGGNITKINSVEEAPDVIMEQSERPSDKRMHTANYGISSSTREISKNLTDEHIRGEEGTSASGTRSEKDSRGQKSRRASDLSKTISVVPESENGARSTPYENTASALNDCNIKENCLVEVFKDNGDFTGAWFSANVLSLKDGKAFVSYAELESDEGKLNEWVSLEAEGSKPPVIRLAHPMTNLMSEGTRKRRRAAARDYTWSLGDRVDAWMGNCWHEGIIVEKNKKDETTLSFHCPAQGKTSVVKVWHLRPTLIWKDGKWIESLSSGQDYSLQGDTPKEKRLKLGSPAIENKGKGKISKNVDPDESRKFEESSLLPLSATEKIFKVGSTKNDKAEAHRTMRSGLQKEGSKVIFGVPKPGKKRKFMEVSKHYVSDRGPKNSAPADSQKFARYLIPHGSGARGWKNNSKIDSKEKQAVESKTKGFKSGKPPSESSRTLTQKDKSIISSVSASKDASSTDNLTKDITDNDENDSGQQNLIELVSSSNIKDGAEDPNSLSSQAPLSDARKKMAAFNTKSDRLKKGKLAPAGGKSNRVEDKGKSIPELVEPRRSNRRIQPTSRLLEGLQSSLIISKIPSVSHDKSHRSQNRCGVPRGNNN